MTIVDFQDANHITVEFTDTHYRVQTKHQQFKEGCVEDKIATANNYLLMEKMQLCGLKAKITDYIPDDKNPKHRQSAKYTITFEDGYSVSSTRNTEMHNFLHGVLKHPKYPMSAGSVVNGVKIIKKHFNIGNEPQMLCCCNNCGWKDIASFKEIYAHKCV